MQVADFHLIPKAEYNTYYGAQALTVAMQIIL